MVIEDYLKLVISGVRVIKIEVNLHCATEVMSLFGTFFFKGKVDL